MSSPSDETSPAPEVDHEAERREMTEVQQQLDDEADGEGLAAEAGHGETMGISEG
jgi:hypothetical protein